MEKRYSRLSKEERVEIEKLLSHNKSYSEIAIALGRHKSTIQREVSGFGRSKYNCLKSHCTAVVKSSNRRYSKTKLRLNSELEGYVLKKLELYWSPRQISVNLSKEYVGDKSMQLSHETIYQYVYVHCKPELRKEVISYLRQKRNYRGNQRRGQDKRSTIKDPVRIDERPEEVKGREVPGHWEGDLILGKNRESAIGTLVERTTRTIILVHLKRRDAESVRKAFEKEFKEIPRQMKKTLTYDNGTEMAEHKLFTRHTKIQVYFAHPYSPWERPTNENSNGLIRDFFPKGTDLSIVSRKRLKQVQNWLNERPRQVLNWSTPKEVFTEWLNKELDNQPDPTQKEKRNQN